VQIHRPTLDIELETPRRNGGGQRPHAVQLVLDHLDDLPHGKAVGELVHAVIDLVEADGR
jgi:hypothetical protein